MFGYKHLENKLYTLYKRLSQSPLCLTPCDLMDYSLPGSSVHGISQVRILEWVAIPFSRGLPNPWIEPRSPALQEDSLLSEPPKTFPNFFYKISLLW